MATLSQPAVPRAPCRTKRPVNAKSQEKSQEERTRTTGTRDGERHGNGGHSGGEVPRLRRPQRAAEPEGKPVGTLPYNVADRSRAEPPGSEREIGAIGGDGRALSSCDGGSWGISVNAIGEDSARIFVNFSVIQSD